MTTTTTLAERLRQLRLERQLTQEQLGKAVGFPEGQERQRVHKIETGRVELTAEMLVKFAEALQTGVQDILQGGGLSEASPVFFESAVSEGDTIPLLAYGEDGARQVVGAKLRPPSLRGVRHGYAVYAPDDCMVPRYAPGWLLYINPARPPAAGRDVLVLRREGAPMVRQLVRPVGTGKPVALRALAQRGSTLLQPSEIGAIHLIVGCDQEG